MMITTTFPHKLVGAQEVFAKFERSNIKLKTIYKSILNDIGKRIKRVELTETFILYSIPETILHQRQYNKEDAKVIIMQTLKHPKYNYKVTVMDDDPYELKIGWFLKTRREYLQDLANQLITEDRPISLPLPIPKPKVTQTTPTPTPIHHPPSSKKVVHFE